MFHSSSLNVLFSLLFSCIFRIIIINNYYNNYHSISADILISDLHKLQKYGECSFNSMVDAGANEGFFTKKIKKTFSDIKILAIEGNNDMKPKLDKIVHEYGNDGSICIIVQIALLGNSSGSSVIYYNNPNAHTGSMIYMYISIVSSLSSSSSS